MTDDHDHNTARTLIADGGPVFVARLTPELRARLFPDVTVSLLPRPSA